VVIAGNDPDEDNGSKKRFHILYRGSNQVVRTLDLDTLGRALFAELESTMFDERDDAIYVEAAPLAMDGRVALIPGNYLSSMWRLSRRLHQAGVRLPLSRTVAVELGTGRLIPITPKLEVPGDALERLNEAVGKEAQAILGVAGGRRSGHDHLERWALTTPAAPISILTTGGDEGPRQPQSRGQTVYRLAGMTMNLAKVGVAGLESLSLMASQAQCYKFYGVTGSPAGRSRLLNDIASSLSE
jgi:hypothetical protein